MVLQSEDKKQTIFRVLITQINPIDGKVKEVNGVKLIGGVIYDRLGESLGYVYEHSKYDANYNRKPEHYIKNWYEK